MGSERPSLVNGINQNRIAAQACTPARDSLGPHSPSSSKHQAEDSTGAGGGSIGGAGVEAGAMSAAGVSVMAGSLGAAGGSSPAGGGAGSSVGAGAAVQRLRSRLPALPEGLGQPAPVQAWVPVSPKASWRSPESHWRIQ